MFVLTWRYVITKCTENVSKAAWSVMFSCFAVPLLHDIPRVPNANFSSVYICLPISCLRKKCSLPILTDKMKSSLSLCQQDKPVSILTAQRVRRLNLHGAVSNGFLKSRRPETSSCFCFLSRAFFCVLLPTSIALKVYVFGHIACLAKPETRTFCPKIDCKIKSFSCDWLLCQVVRLVLSEQKWSKRNRKPALSVLPKHAGELSQWKVLRHRPERVAPKDFHVA